MISRDPSKPPELDDEIVEAAKALNKGIINVICDRPGAQVDDAGALSFFAIVDFVPRIGEIIITQNKKRCRVKRIYYGISPVHQLDRQVALTLVPNIVAELIDGDEEE